jgi:hypothetical protein
VQFEEEEADKSKSAGGREQQAEEGRLVTKNMNIDFPPLTSLEITPQPLLFELSTPAPPLSIATTPHLTVEDPVGDALITVFQAIAGPRLTSHGGPDHTPLTSEGWYEYMLGDAHVWMEIPLFHIDSDDKDKLSPAKYLKVTLKARTPILQGCQGQGQNIDSEQLLACPFHAAGNCFYHFDTSLEILENPFDPRVERTLLFLGDLGVLADVYML